MNATLTLVDLAGTIALVANATVTGHPPGTTPDEYAGGLGARGVQELKAFAEAGGTLVALDAAARLAVHDLGLGVRDALDGRAEHLLDHPQPVVLRA